MQDLFRSLPQVFKEFKGSEAANEAVVFAAWRRMAGETLGSHAVPFRLEKKKLFIAVSSETWRKQVEDLAGQMVFQMNSALGSSLVTFIEFRVDPKTVAEKRPKNLLALESEDELNAAAMKVISPGLKAAAETITDERLRQKFLLAAGSSLSRNKRLNRISSPTATNIKGQRESLG